MLTRKSQVTRISRLGHRSMSFFDSLFSSNERTEQEEAASPSNGFQLALLGYVAKTMPPKDSLGRILKKDPHFIMGHILVGVSNYLYPRLHSDSLDARRHVDLAKKLVSSGHASKLDKMHVHALDALVHGRFREASVAYESILREDTTDLLALQCTVDVYTILGDKRNMLEAVSRVLPQWPSSHPGYSHILSLQAFGLQEMGDFGAASSLAQRAMSMNDHDAVAFHALLHTFECQGNHSDGASVVMRNEDSWSKYRLVHAHLTVHWIYFLIETGRFDRVETLLRNDVFVAGEVISAQTLVDATQVYWRLRLAGYDAPHLLDLLDEQWQFVIKDATDIPLTPLAALHAHSIFTLQRPDDESAKDLIPQEAFTCDVEALRTSLETPVVLTFSHALPGNGERNILSKLTEALTAYAKGDYNQAVDKLLAVRGFLHVLGGTRVEAELWELLLIDAAKRGSQLDIAKLLLNERINVKPQSAQYWKTYGDVLEAQDDQDGVDGARRMSYVLGLGQAGTGAS
ncbi:hypothetical protein Ae201684P_016893 [Aphanomyces euteiches]|nr:hypothetical protein Ae201684P_016893 [Aphanomyces euteiches]KAH9143963.1 hypothetical protein AeRB84_012059 [Aphanomyces euteiches]